MWKPILILIGILLIVLFAASIVNAQGLDNSEAPGPDSLGGYEFGPECCGPYGWNTGTVGTGTVGPGEVAPETGDPVSPEVNPEIGDTVEPDTTP